MFTNAIEKARCFAMLSLCVGASACELSPQPVIPVVSEDVPGTDGSQQPNLPGGGLGVGDSASGGAAPSTGGAAPTGGVAGVSGGAPGWGGGAGALTSPDPDAVDAEGESAFAVDAEGSHSSDPWK